MNPQGNTNASVQQSIHLTSEELSELQNETIGNAKHFALKGSKTTRHAKNYGVKNPIDYDWWTNETTYDEFFWSVSYWNFHDTQLQIQITKLLLQENGRSIMTSYSIRDNDDPNFPGFQIY